MTNWANRILFPVPEDERPVLVRPKVDGDCPKCGGGDIRRYPIANHQGPRMITRCQDCFEVLALEKPSADDVWPPYRAVAHDWDASLAERASKDRLERGEG